MYFTITGEKFQKYIHCDNATSQNKMSNQKFIKNVNKYGNCMQNMAICLPNVVV